MKEENKGARCFETKAWLSYQAGFLSKSECALKEEHLLSCENCFETFLNIIETSTNPAEGTSLSSGFTDRVMSMVTKLDEVRFKESKFKESKPKEAANSRVNLFIGYCAAASIAMFFWIGGYFGGLSGSIAKGMEIGMEIQPKIGLIQQGWTQKVLEEKESTFIENIIPKKGVDK